MKSLFVVAPADFKDDELFKTMSCLDAIGISSDIASTVECNATGMLGGKIEISKTIHAVKLHNYSAVIFIGGAGVLKTKFDEDVNLQSFARHAYSQVPVVGAISLGVRILAKSGILTGKNATILPDNNNIDILLEAGANYVPSGVVVDGKIITSNGPHMVNEFVEAIFSVLKK